MLGLTACDLDDLLNVEDRDVVNPGTLEDPEYLPLALMKPWSLPMFIVVALLLPIGLLLRAAVLVPLGALIAANDPISNPSALEIGQRIRIPR